MAQFDLLSEARKLPKRYLRQGGYLYRRGDKCDNNIYIIVDGTIARIDENGTFRLGTDAGPGALVGDVEVMAGATERLQTWKAKSPDVTLAIMDKRAADFVGGTHPEFFLLLLKSSIDNLHTAERELIEKDRPG